MFRKFNLATGVLALLLFSYAQYQGWNYFENTANGGGHGSGGSGRTYHK